MMEDPEQYRELNGIYYFNDFTILVYFKVKNQTNVFIASQICRLKPFLVLYASKQDSPCFLTIRQSQLNI